MARHASLGSLAARIDQMASNLGNSMKAKRDHSYIEMADALGRLTPVDTLEARTSWNPSLGGFVSNAAGGPRLPSASARENLLAGKFNETAGRSFTFGRAARLAAQITQPDALLSLSNDAEHIVGLNNGGSPQLPAGGFMQIASIESLRAAQSRPVRL